MSSTATTATTTMTTVVVDDDDEPSAVVVSGMTSKMRWVSMPAVCHTTDRWLGDGLHGSASVQKS